MDKNENKQRVLVVGGYKATVPEAVKRSCHLCKADVWIMLWNDDKIPMCMFCADRMMDEQLCELVVNKRDADRAAEEIKRRENETFNADKLTSS